MQDLSEANNTQQGEVLSEEQQEFLVRAQQQLVLGSPTLSRCSNRAVSSNSASTSSERFDHLATTVAEQAVEDANLVQGWQGVSTTDDKASDDLHEAIWHVGGIRQKNFSEDCGLGERGRQLGRKRARDAINGNLRKREKCEKIGTQDTNWTSPNKEQQTFEETPPETCDKQELGPQASGCIFIEDVLNHEENSSTHVRKVIAEWVRNAAISPDWEQVCMLKVFLKHSIKVGAIERVQVVLLFLRRHADSLGSFSRHRLTWIGAFNYLLEAVQSSLTKLDLGKLKIAQLLG